MTSSLIIKIEAVCHKAGGSKSGGSLEQRHYNAREAYREQRRNNKEKEGKNKETESSKWEKIKTIVNKKVSLSHVVNFRSTLAGHSQRA